MKAYTSCSMSYMTSRPSKYGLAVHLALCSVWFRPRYHCDHLIPIAAQRALHCMLHHILYFLTWLCIFMFEYIRATADDEAYKIDLSPPVT